VYGETDLVPLQTLELDTARSFESLVTLTLDDQFNPSNQVVMLDSEAKKLSKKQFSKEGTIKMTKYAPNQIDYKADVNGKQLIVFSEMYYKDGWKAFVNGKEKEILKVNYALRGLEVDGGKSTIEFKYDLPKFHTAEMMARVGSIFILLLIGGILFLDFTKARANKLKK
ncbi:YfhO family protein, partial [bacterium]|nr:YfhO family protein [bacterium]